MKNVDWRKVDAYTCSWLEGILKVLGLIQEDSYANLEVLSERTNYYNYKDQRCKFTKLELKLRALTMAASINDSLEIVEKVCDHGDNGNESRRLSRLKTTTERLQNRPQRDGERRLLTETERRP
ncbi:hypothetical protein YC2023_052307 [Brassica napus]